LIDHADVIFRTGPRATYLVLAGDLVPAGTTLVTPEIIVQLPLWCHCSLENVGFCNSGQVIFTSFTKIRYWRLSVFCMAPSVLVGCLFANV